MKGKMIKPIAAVALCAAFLISGCSVPFRHPVSDTEANESVGSVSSSSVMSSSNAMKIDESLQEPAFKTDLTGCVTVLKDAELSLHAEASVTDGGKVTYQWYRNSVNNNGGGTAIGGATQTTVTADTSETGNTFYYVVATNTKGQRENMSVTSTFEVKVIEKGTWEKDSTGYKYMLEDNTYLSDTVFEESGKIYTINADGYRTDDGKTAPATLTSNSATMDPPPETSSDSSSSSSSAAPSEASASSAAS
ncbi:MAG: hypothetical protein ACOYBC_09195 [Bilifractor sp.]|jgi:hypothetical protein